jgi:serine/threonine protein kinase
VEKILSRSRGLLLQAVHTGFDQRVVIRVLSPALTDARAVARFQREARTLSMLESDYASRIIDFGTLRDGSLYLVREHLEGVSLAEQARRRGGLPLQEAVLHFLQVCEAVQECHSHNIVLRDLHAEHVFITKKRTGAVLAKLTEFGTSKVMRSDESGELTCTRLLGLSSSASPELVRQQKSIDARADVWSLGCMLYEILTARPAFLGDGIELMLAITQDEPAGVSRTRSDLPKIMDQIVRWALAKEPDQRFCSVYAFAHELRPFACPRGEVIIDQIAQLACPGGMHRSLAPPAAIALAPPDQDSLTMVRSVEPAPQSAPPQSVPTPRPIPAPVPIARPASSTPAVVISVPEPPPVHRSSPDSETAPARPLPQFSPVDSGTHPWMVAPARRPWVAAVWGALITIPLCALLIALAFSTPTRVAQATVGWDVAAHAAAEEVDEPTHEVTVGATITADEADAPQAKRNVPRAASRARRPRASSSRSSSARSSSANSRNSQFLEQIGSKKKKKSKSSKKRSAKKKANAGGRGTIVAMAVGASCSFAVDGAPRGISSSVRVTAQVGSHRVSCSRVGGTSRSRTVQVRRGKTTVAVFRF